MMRLIWLGTLSVCAYAATPTFSKDVAPILYKNCASCHRPEYSFADPRRVSVSDSGRRGQRHAPSLINAGFSPLFMWDGAFSNA